MVPSKLNIPAVLVSFLLAGAAFAAPNKVIDASKSLAVKDLIPHDYIDQVFAYHEAKAQAKKRPEGDEYSVDSECTDNTVCQNGITPRGTDPRTGETIFDDDIMCVPDTPQADATDPTNRRQYGFREVRGTTSTIVTPIPVLENNGASSVSAVILSGDKSFVINPSGTLSANLRGFDLELCRQNNPGRPTPNNSRQCVPAVEFTLRAGDTIDFTYRLDVVQSGF